MWLQRECKNIFVFSKYFIFVFLFLCFSIEIQWNEKIKIFKFFRNVNVVLIYLWKFFKVSDFLERQSDSNRNTKKYLCFRNIFFIFCFCVFIFVFLKWNQIKLSIFSIWTSCCYIYAKTSVNTETNIFPTEVTVCN
jgi:hypothetical protein